MEDQMRIPLQRFSRLLPAMIHTHVAPKAVCVYMLLTQGSPKNSSRVTCEVLRQTKSRAPAQTCWAGVSVQARSRDLLNKHSKWFSHCCIQRATKPGNCGTCLELLGASYLSPGQGSTLGRSGFYPLGTTTGPLWDHVPHETSWHSKSPRNCRPFSHRSSLSDTEDLSSSVPQGSEEANCQILPKVEMTSLGILKSDFTAGDGTFFFELPI